MVETDRLQYLVKKYLGSTISNSELEELETHLRNSSGDALSPTLEELWEKLKENQIRYPVNWDQMYANVLQADHTLRKGDLRVRTIRRRWMVAASVIALVGLAAYLWTSREYRSPNEFTTNLALQTDIQPGKEGAVLKLADGTELLLDTVKSGAGRIANQGKSAFSVNQGTLIYSALADAAVPNGTELYNTMTTPHGRQFSLQLPDGTRVWLNAGSSIRFPVVFSPNERRVEITGEAYFDVAQKTNQPFIVKTRRQTIEVLGTEFNVNTYEDEEAERTTLLNGAVRVVGNGSARNSPVILKPGQQAVLTHSSRSLSTNIPKNQQLTPNVHNVSDLNKVVAWKNGLFDFSNASLEEVMRQLARWYDIRVEFEGEVPDIEFAGRVGRDVSLSRMLVFFKESGVNFRIEEGNKLIIGKK